MLVLPVLVFLKKYNVPNPGFFFQRLWGRLEQPKAAPMLSFEGKSEFFCPFSDFFLNVLLNKSCPRCEFLPEGQKLSFFRS